MSNTDQTNAAYHADCIADIYEHRARQVRNHADRERESEQNQLAAMWRDKARRERGEML